MSVLTFEIIEGATRFGLKGPRASEWLAGHGISVPFAANSWTDSGVSGAAAERVLIARLGTGEFFLEGAAGGALKRIAPAADTPPPGVYPVLREDAAFSLAGDGADEVLAQVCNVNFAELDLDAQPVVMTSMMGVSVLVVPHDAESGRWYRIWCDPTFEHYVEETLGRIVVECGGSYMGVTL